VVALPIGIIAGVVLAFMPDEIKNKVGL
jgi:hypothetical protein